MKRQQEDNKKARQERREKKIPPRRESRTRDAGGREMKKDGPLYAGGRNSAAEALKAGLVKRLFVKDGKKDDRLLRLMADAEEQGVPVSEKEERELDRLVPELRHQGAVAELRPYQYADLDAVLDAWEGKDPFHPHGGMRRRGGGASPGAQKLPGDVCRHEDRRWGVRLHAGRPHRQYPSDAG